MAAYRRSHQGDDRGYRSREEAGKHLAAALHDLAGPETLVLGIPRGGVPIAAEVARALGAGLDIIVARKLGAPYQPELAIGAVTANGGLFIDHEMVRDLGVRESYLDEITERESSVAHNREMRFRGGRRAPRIEGRTVIVVDDGLATGATMRAAVRSIRKQHPARLVVAVPVGSDEACSSLAPEADDVFCPLMPDPFFAVGMYYRDFLPVEDDEVENILANFREEARSRTIEAPD